MGKIFALLLLPLSVFSQPIITSTINPKPGDSYKSIRFDSIDVVPGPAGENVEWDFSWVKPTDSMTLSYLTATETPYAALYPEANIAMTSDKSSYQYFLFTDSGYYSKGQFKVKEGGYWVISDFFAYWMFKYPLKYGVSFKTEGLRISKHPNVTIYEFSKTNIKADAWGTLMLPYGKIKNVLRLHAETIDNDSIVRFDGIYHQTVKIDKYIWFAPDIMIPINDLTLTTSNSIQFGTEVNTDYSYAVVLNENYLNDKNKFPLNLKIISDPSFENKLALSFDLPEDGKVEILISNMSGQRVKGRTEQGLKGNNIVRIDCDQLSSASYQVLLQADNAYEAVKWVYIK